MRRITIILIIIALMSAGVIFWSWQKNIYSKDVLKLEILGQSEVNFGQEVEYIIKYKNNGNFRLDNPQLIFEPPSYSMKDEKIFGRQTLGPEQLGEAIYPGQEKSFSFKMRIFGSDGEIKKVKASLSYNPKDLKARYESSSDFTTAIKSVPINFDIDIPSKVEAGKDFNFRLNYFSNVDYILSDLRIKIEYPIGFEFSGSNQKSMDNNEWEIPILNKFQGGRIEIRGAILGQSGEAKIFKAKIGMWKDGEFILLKEVIRGVELIDPYIYIRQEINGNPQYAALPGDWLHYEIYFKNIGNEGLNNLLMISRLEGLAFDFETVRSDTGSFQKEERSIIFDWRKVPELQYLDSMEEGKVDFWIKIKDDFGEAQNPVLRNKIFLGQVKQEFLTKVSSKIEIAQNGYFHNEVFENSGTLPPEVGKSTTYTIVWEVKNRYSDAKNVKVKAVLPPEFSLTGKIFPEDMSSKFSFDSESKEIVWSLGDLEKGIGVSKPSQSIVFQISFIPSAYQRGKTPDIIGKAEISGDDIWAEKLITNSSPPINITLPDDEKVTDEMGVVQ